MGSSISQIQQENLELETLKILCGSDFSEQIYNAYKNPDGTFPKMKFLQISQHTDLFLTHNWGKNEVNHKRVARIKDFLVSRGLIVWFDDERMTGTIVDQMM
jgi:hypothetical protein